MEQRAARCQPNLEAVRRSLEEMAGYAERGEIKIGLENRLYYTEIPSHEEIGAFLALHPNLFYWHDTGHAQAQANLGFAPHQGWLRAYGERMLGIHFHDIRGLRDHGIPGQGEIDFAGLAPYIPPEALRVCEFDYIYPPEEVVAGREHLVKAGCL
jgi:sugar phosphate isomerase/epimerase